MNSAPRDRFLGLVGFPRSGTTVLTALLDAHDDVCMYYEPWNASPQQRPNPPATVGDFRALMERRFGFSAAGAPLVGFKETVTYSESREFAVRTIDNVARETPTSVVWIFRDPIHCFLSKLDGARKWWGRPDAGFSRAALEQYLRESGPHLAALQDLVGRHGGTIVSYEALASRPEETLRALMHALDLPFCAAQLDYYKAGAHPERVMGDPDVRERPSPVSRAASERRAHEAGSHRDVIEDVLSAPEFAGFQSECARLADLPGVASVARRRGP